MSYIGIIGAGRLDKADSSLFLLEAKEKAVSLLQNGIGMDKAKRMTGWETGVDGKWRYEVDDPFHTTAEIEDYMKRHYGESIDIRFCMKNTLLLTAYPEFERLRLFCRYTPADKFMGYFDPKRYGMVVCMGTAGSPFKYQTEGVLLHEVQHLIQEAEGFARGGDAKRGRGRYLRLAGEVEARNVCARHFLSLEQRLSTLRTETQDVPDGEQIVTWR